MTTPLSTTSASDTLIVALFSLGAFLLLVAAFFSRIGSITLPGGAAITLTPAGQAAAAGAIAAATPTGDPGKQLGKNAYVRATRNLQTVQDVDSFTQDDLEGIVREAIAEATTPGG
jgi:hypothetical protein